MERVLWFESVGMNDVHKVGGKNASLGEMIRELSDAEVRVPGGFATTAEAFWEFLQGDGLKSRIDQALDGLDVDDVRALAETGRRIRAWVEEAPLPEALEQAVREAYQRLGDGQPVPVAVRSSATAEDLPEAS
ncbi:MAG: phosphoenolpyruvate synthase, partial [Gammaproteobacteria bacterium]|nr:phosphoenolpyruvate synthase [Gammaproteobacteria bacterium]